MRIVIAPDSFKGSLSAPVAAAAMARGVRVAMPDAEVLVVPLADGGEGTAAALVAATGGKMVTVPVVGPLGEPVQAAFGILGDGRTAVIEMAAASGLLLLPGERRDPRLTTTFGTGELIRAALDLNLDRILIGLGGSATNDGGAGMITALGGRLLKADGTPIALGGAGLLALDRLDLSELDPRLREVEVLVACDVSNPLCGPQGASAVYGPQKGAGPDTVVLLDRALQRLADVAAHTFGRDLRGVPGAGAAGGLGFGLISFVGGSLRSGIELVMDAVGFDRHLEGALLVITGEGRTDAQSLAGKVVQGVAKRAAAHGVPAVVISGAVESMAEPLLDQNVVAMLSIADGPVTLQEAMLRAEELLARSCRQALGLVKLGLDWNRP